jgi:glycogen operon protein
LSLNQTLRQAEIQPHGVRLGAPDLSADSHSLAVTVRGPGGVTLFHVMFNAYWEPLTFEVPHLEPGIHEGWRRWIDTFQDAPADISDDLGPSVEGPGYTVHARSLVVLSAALRGIAMTSRGTTTGSGQHL